MTPIASHTPERSRNLTRFSASARPMPPPLATDRPSPAPSDPLGAVTVIRAKITATLVAILAIVALFVAAPPTVTVPLAVALFAGVVVSGVLLTVERVRGANDAAADASRASPRSGGPTPGYS